MSWNPEKKMVSLLELPEVLKQFTKHYSSLTLINCLC